MTGDRNTRETPASGHLHVAANERGRDFVAGDVHGMFTELEQALDACEFDASQDRLFSVGDLIDRGTESDEALTWLESGRICAATLGNHEEMMIDALYGPDSGVRERTRAMWRDSANEWWEQREHTHAELRRWEAALRALPLAITLDTAHGPVGIVHALPCPGPWSETVRSCAGGARARACMLWGIRPLGEPTPSTVQRNTEGEPRAIIAGHFATDTPHVSGRITNIDSGSGLDVAGARVTVANVSASRISYHSSPHDGARVSAPLREKHHPDNAVIEVASTAASSIMRWWKRQR